MFKFFDCVRLGGACLGEIGLKLFPFGFDCGGFLLLFREPGFQLMCRTLHPDKFGGGFRGCFDLLFQLGFGFFRFVVRGLQRIERGLAVGSRLLCDSEFRGGLVRGGFLGAEVRSEFCVGIGQRLYLLFQLRVLFDGSLFSLSGGFQRVAFGDQAIHLFLKIVLFFREGSRLFHGIFGSFHGILIRGDLFLKGLHLTAKCRNLGDRLLVDRFIGRLRPGLR